MEDTRMAFLILPCGSWNSGASENTIYRRFSRAIRGCISRLRSMGATGKYAKVDGQLYGIVKVTWQFLQNGVYDVTVPYYDALYYLVDADGSYRTVSCEELQNLPGEDAFLIEPTTPEELERGY